jgi:ribosome-associated protein
MIAHPSTRNTETSTVLSACIQALDDKKAEDIRLLHVGAISSIADDLVIATGTSNPHLKAMAEAVVEVLERHGSDCVASPTGDQSGWVILDAYDFMVHIFTEETRRYYNLEGLWKA